MWNPSRILAGQMDVNATNQELQKKDRPPRRSYLFLRVFAQSGSPCLTLANGLDDAVNFRLRECGSTSVGLLII